MKIHDYLIEQSGHDWATLLADWHWILPRDFTLWLVNRFGDLFVVLDDDSVHMLDVGGGTLEKIAENRDHFATRIDEGDNANNWFMIPLVDKCIEAGLNLSEGGVYCYRTPPILGGDYTVENTEVGDLGVHLSVLGQLQLKVKDLPDGTTVSGITID